MSKCELITSIECIFKITSLSLISIKDVFYAHSVTLMFPGLLVSYCHGFDLKVNSRRVYFFGTVVGK